MQKKCLKIVALVLLLAGVAISLNLCFHRKTNWGILMKENVEALTTPETENPHYPCIRAAGFCFINGIDIDGVALVD